MSQTCQAEGCPLDVHASGELCYLHVPEDGKERELLRSAFASLTERGVIRIDNLHLRAADLSGLVLELKNLRRSDLTEANLTGSRLTKVGFDQSILDRVDMEGAILEKVDLRRVESMREAALFEVIFDGVQIPHVDRIGTVCAYAAGGQPDLHKAEYVYRQLKELYKNQGDHDSSGLFYELEMDTRRNAAPALDRIWLTALWLLCGYGERPARAVTFSLVVIVGFALAFTPLQLAGPDGPVQGDLVEALYFSTVTFTTLGYGDIRPVGIARGLAASEAIIGAFTMALFIFVFCRRMVR